MVRQSGGRLWAYSQPGKGATFRIYLPQSGAHFPALPPHTEQLRHGATILLVELHDGLRAAMADVLKRCGYRVLAAIHPAEALRITEAQGPPDLLITRPDPELVRQMEHVQPRLPTLYLTGYADDRDLPVLSPRMSMLRNPFEPKTLLAKVQELLNA